MPNAIASADWGVQHPALCYELGDTHGEQFVPRAIITETLWQPRLTIAIWQPEYITLIDMLHTPRRSNTRMVMIRPGQRPVSDWCVIQRYSNGPDGAVFLDMQENIDPKVVVPELREVLSTPLGQPPFTEQTLLAPDQQIERILIEYPGYQETHALPRDTSITVLAGIATQEYLNTIYGEPAV